MVIAGFVTKGKKTEPGDGHAGFVTKGKLRDKGKKIDEAVSLCVYNSSRSEAFQLH